MKKRLILLFIFLVILLGSAFGIVYFSSPFETGPDPNDPPNALVWVSAIGALVGSVGTLAVGMSTLIGAIKKGGKKQDVKTEEKKVPKPLSASTPGRETESRVKRFCSYCGTVIAIGDVFCSKCGAGIKNEEKNEENDLSCPKCSALLKNGDKYCRKCGIEFE